MTRSIRTQVGRTVTAGAVALVVPLLLTAPALADEAGHPAPPRDRVTSPEDPSGASGDGRARFQGASPSAPDQDGRGPERDVDGDDKSGVNAGGSTDGNNGCGNEPRTAAPSDGGRPTDDDNEGWCGGKPRPVREPAPAPAPEPVTEQPGEPAERLPGEQPATPAARPVAEPAAGPVAGASEVPSSGAAAGTAAAPAEVLAGLVTVGGTAAATPLPGLGTGAAAEVGPARPAVLPFTGAPALLLLVAGAGAAGTGGLLLAAARRP